MAAIQINRSSDCGHSPKNRVLEDLAIARWTLDSAKLVELLSEDVELHVVGKPPIRGRESVIAAGRQNILAPLRELTILHVSQHGRIGAVNGRVSTRKGNTIDFCDVCEFTNAKGTSVSAITSYAIESSR